MGERGGNAKKKKKRLIAGYLCGGRRTGSETADSNTKCEGRRKAAPATALPLFLLSILYSYCISPSFPTNALSPSPAIHANLSQLPLLHQSRRH